MIVNSQKEKLVKRLTEIDERKCFLESSLENSSLSKSVKEKINDEIRVLDHETYEIVKEINSIVLDINPEDFKKAVKQGGVLLTEEDKIIIPRQSDFTSLKDLCMVHKTNYLPWDNVLKSVAASKVETKETYKYPGSEKEQEIVMAQSRSSVHFSLNGEVGSHDYGNWETCRYGIITPFPEYDYERGNLLAANTEDTYFYYQYPLGQDSYILVPKEELEEAKRLNPQVNIIPYEGENVTGYLDAVVSFLGYKQEKVENHSWKNTEDKKLVSELFKKFNFAQHPHTSTKYYYMDLYNKHDQLLFGYIRNLKKDLSIELNDQIKKEISHEIEFLLLCINEICTYDNEWGSNNFKIQYLKKAGELLQSLLKYRFEVWHVIEDIRHMVEEPIYKSRDYIKNITNNLTETIMEQLAEYRLLNSVENNVDVIGGR